jgi:hypothetical protein
MTGTQHVGTLKRQFLHYITIKMVLVLFYKKKKLTAFLGVLPLLFGSDIYNSKSELFQRWPEWEFK